MAITIKQMGQKWRIELHEEEWNFESRAEMEKGLKTLLDIKENKGNIRGQIK
jgi:hypothetical protein